MPELLLHCTSRLCLSPPRWSKARRTLFLVLLFLLAGLLAGMANAADGFLTADEAFALTVEQSPATHAELELHWKIAQGYYLYRDRISVTAAPSGNRTTVDRPSGERKEDPNFGVMEVYRRAATVQVNPSGATELTVTWQGCADAGLCYPPQSQKIAVDASALTLAANPAPSAARDADDSDVATPPVGSFTVAKTALATSSGTSDSHITQVLGERTLALTLPLFFVLGIGLAFTPCVLPMVPIVSGIVVGSQAPPLRAFVLSLAFVLPMALTYALLGAAAAIMGENIQALLQNRWAITIFSAIFVALAAAMFGFFTLQLPSFVRDRINGASRHTQGGTLLGATALGLLSALLVGPCMTAPLAGTLLYIAQTGHVASGALLLFALGLGMGVPLIIIATLGARYLPKPGPWMERVKGAFGFLLLGTAIWMLQRVAPTSLVLILWGSLLAGLALTLFHLATQIDTGLRLLCRSMAFIVGVWAGSMLVGAAAGGDDPLRPLAFAMPSSAAVTATSRENAAPLLQFNAVGSLQALQAQLDMASRSERPVLLDYSADWCVSCKTIDREVFSDPIVRSALSNVLLLRANVTEDDVDQRALMREYHVIGPPTVMFFNAKGGEQRDARLVGEFSVSDLLQRLLAGKASTATKAGL
ncbi:protein-disulfide reductase DsbD [Herbaspirillum sp. RV1423]|uniref:protein-disulfide reductase DsbD n=1 Tax=Herbaspirillum sp. RV1423 TaxID=1443993 RepID=UPI0018CC09D1|nr:protein-disulfide reductase DsbD [Herbaspirillum sp. RV1423]